MASWSNVIDREKWRLALLGGIEVRRASGNEEAGNGGNGAGGLSKPKLFYWTSRPYPLPVEDSGVSIGVLPTSGRITFNPSAEEAAMVGISLLSVTLRNLRKDLFPEDLVVATANLVSVTKRNVLVKVFAEDNARVGINLISVSKKKLLITYSSDEEQVQTGCTLVSVKKGTS